MRELDVIDVCRQVKATSHISVISQNEFIIMYVHIHTCVMIPTNVQYRPDMC